MHLYPEGAKGPLAEGGNELVKFYIVAWADVFLFMLISKASTNLIKFGMSWHVYLMMSFMKPQGPSLGRIPSGIQGIQLDSEATAVIFTNVLGAVLAVFVTYMPPPIMR